MAKSLCLSKGTLFTCVLLAALGALVAWASSDATQSPILDTYRCELPRYNVRVVSYDPLMVHLENFITQREKEHLLNLATPHLRRATVEFMNGSVQHTPIRTSSTARLNDTDKDPIVQCFLHRLTEFQGHVPTSRVERLQVTTYEPGQHYGQHLDSLGNTSKLVADRWQRTTTSFGILSATCEKCGTQFPKIRTDWTLAKGNRWCNILDCEEEFLTVKPIPGSVLFWRNLDREGGPDMRTIHTGMPVTAGTKAGVNIWTRIDPSESIVRPVY